MVIEELWFEEWKVKTENTDLDYNFLDFETGAVVDADIATERLSQVNRAVKRVIRGLKL